MSFETVIWVLLAIFVGVMLYRFFSAKPPAASVGYVAEIEETRRQLKRLKNDSARKVEEYYRKKAEYDALNNGSNSGDDGGGPKQGA